MSVVALSGAVFLVAADIESRRADGRWRVERPAGAVRTSPSGLLAAARARHPELDPLSVEIRRDDARPAVVRFREGVALHLDPWNGRVLGETGEGESLSGRLVTLHTRLFAGEPGGLVVLIATAALVGLVPLGMLLWWPRRRAALGRALTVELRRGVRRANYDLHNVLGFYVSVVVLVLAATGVLLATPSLRDLGRRAVAKVLPAPEAASLPPVEAGAPAPEGVTTLDAALGHGRRLFPGAPWVRAVLPGGSSSTIRVLAAESPDGDATRYHTVRVGGDGAVRRVDRYGDASPAERFDRLVNQLHTASGLGPVYRWVAIVACLVTGTLPITGFLIWLDRRRRARRRRAGTREDPEPGIAAVGD